MYILRTMTNPGSIHKQLPYVPFLTTTYALVHVRDFLTTKLTAKLNALFGQEQELEEEDEDGEDKQEEKDDDEDEEDE